MSDRQKTLQRYVSDMVSVEEHILEAIKHQVKDGDFKEFPMAHEFVSKTETVLRDHVDALHKHLDTLGGDPANPVKEAVTSVLGKAAGIIDQVRQNDKISADLRDDYTALNLAAVSYTLLHTTGLALQDQKTASLAQKHLMDLTPLITRINEIIPQVAVQELKDEGATVGATIADQARSNTQKAWSHEHIHQGHSHNWVR
jgi:ferritin-like metal-binding protein YciE